MKTQDTIEIEEALERDGRGKYGSRHEAGYFSLGCKIVEHSIEDYKLLESEGYILNGRAVWPESATKFCDYRSKHQIEELIGFFRDGHAERFLEDINSTIDPDAMLSSLGISTCNP